MNSLYYHFDKLKVLPKSLAKVIQKHHATILPNYSTHYYIEKRSKN